MEDQIGKVEIHELPHLKFYENYKKQAIYIPELSAENPELVRDIPILKNTIFHQWGINVQPYFFGGTDAHLRWLIFQRIRHTGELLEGLFLTENDEFKKVFHVFIKDFFFAEVWVGSHPDLLQMEIDSLKLPNIRNRYTLDDILHTSRFRLYRKYKKVDKGAGLEKWQYSSAISGIEGYDIDDQNIPLVKCTFNQGQMFLEMYDIFMSYEATLQHFRSVLFASGKRIMCRIKDPLAFKEEIGQILSPGVVFAPVSKGAGKSNNWDVFDMNTIDDAQKCYDLIMQKYNDDMARYGLAGDDDAKAERVTTGENFRALQPSAAFQASILSALNRCTLKFKDILQEEITFVPGIQSTPQGIPQYEFRHVKIDGNQQFTNGQEGIQN